MSLTIRGVLVGTRLGAGAVQHAEGGQQMGTVDLG